MVIKIVTRLKRRVGELRKNFKKERKYLKEPIRDEEYNWNEKTPEGIDSRLEDAQEWISCVGDRVMDIIPSLTTKRNKNLKNEDS